MKSADKVCLSRYRSVIVMNSSIGPPFVPGIGSGLSFKFDWRQGFESPSQMIHRLSKDYGPVMRMKMGTADYIFLSGENSFCH